MGWIAGSDRGAGRTDGGSCRVPCLSIDRTRVRVSTPSYGGTGGGSDRRSRVRQVLLDRRGARVYLHPCPPKGRAERSVTSEGISLCPIPRMPSSPGGGEGPRPAPFAPVRSPTWWVVGAHARTAPGKRSRPWDTTIAAVRYGSTNASTPILLGTTCACGTPTGCGSLQVGGCSIDECPWPKHTSRCRRPPRADPVPA
jgi:hypothetical protein